MTVMVRTVLLLALLSPSPAWAGPCAVAAAAAEREFGLPNGLLQAIGRVESGRPDASGKVDGWPWAINAAGQGYFFTDQTAAIAKVIELQARGVRSIDVGCFQVNLLFHPEAFGSLADGFDPARNARAAAMILLGNRAGPGWDRAIALYHSATPSLGLPYAAAVLASWAGGPAMLNPPLSRVALLVRVVTPGSPTLRGAGLPVVITPSGL